MNNQMEELQYYISLTDLECYKKIAALTTSQHKKFEEAMILTNDFRRSLFIASSYPIEGV